MQWENSRTKERRKSHLRFTWLLDAKQVITDIACGEADLDTLKAGASLIPVAKITKVPKIVKAIGNVGKTGFKKGKQGDKTVWKRFTQEDKPKPDKNKGNQSKAGSKSGTTTSKPNQEEASKSSQAKQTKAKNKGDGDSKKSGVPVSEKTKASNGLDYQSNPKHTPGQPGNRPNAGIEPQNSLELFDNSVQSTKKPTQRYAYDESTAILHRFFNNGNGT